MRDAVQRFLHQRRGDSAPSDPATLRFVWCDGGLWRSDLSDVRSRKLARRWRALDEVAHLEAEDSGVHNAVYMFASNPQVALRADVSARSALTKSWDQLAGARARRWWRHGRHGNGVAPVE